jgi:NADPH-dependent curcumin reductase CurA
MKGGVKLAKGKNNTVVGRIVAEVLKMYKYGYHAGKVILSQDTYTDFKKEMSNKYTAIGELKYIDNNEYYLGMKLEVDEDDFLFDYIMIEADYKRDREDL